MKGLTEVYFQQNYKLLPYENPKDQLLASVP